MEKPWEERFQVYVDSGIDIRAHPTEEEGYDAHLIDIDHYVFFPRGTLMDVATADRDRAGQILEQLMPSTIIFEDSMLTVDSLIAAATKAYYLEGERVTKAIRSEIIERLIREGSPTGRLYDGSS